MAASERVNKKTRNEKDYSWDKNHTNPALWACQWACASRLLADYALRASFLLWAAALAPGPNCPSLDNRHSAWDQMKVQESLLVIWLICFNFIFPTC